MAPGEVPLAKQVGIQDTYCLLSMGALAENVVSRFGPWVPRGDSIGVGEKFAVGILSARVGKPQHLYAA